MARVGWTVEARQDLREIRSWIARDSRFYATTTTRRIRVAVQQLAMFPESGRVIPERPGGPYRELIVGQYRVLYRYERENDLVVVINVIHGSRDLQSLLLSDMQ